MPTGKLLRKLEPGFSQAIEEEGCQMITRVKSIGSVRQWSQLLDESVQAPSLEVFKTHSKIPIPDQVGKGATSKLGL